LIKLENLPEITDRALDSLKADDTLKSKILFSAIQKNKPYVHNNNLRLIPIVLSSVAIMVICFVLLNGKKPLFSEDQHLIRSFSAGSSDSSTISIDSFSEIDLMSIKYIELSSSGQKNEPDQLNQLLDALLNHSILVKNTDFSMNDQLNIIGTNGVLLSLPINIPYIEWPDGIRKCDYFFNLFFKSSN
jgi:hypothetical protein